jgi:hypothetical protein
MTRRAIDSRVRALQVLDLLQLLVGDDRHHRGHVTRYLLGWFVLFLPLTSDWQCVQLTPNDLA